MYPDSKAASMVTMVAMVSNSVGKLAKKSVAKFWSTSWSLQTLVVTIQMGRPEVALYIHTATRYFRLRVWGM